MFFKTPEFWYKTPTQYQRFFLRPLSWIYKWISNYNYNKPYDVSLFDKKIIAVGGITAGGAGKTLVVDSICKILRKNEKKVAILSAGYGRSSGKSLKVDNKVHTYKDVGDEPLMLSKQFPVFVGKDRSETADLAQEFKYLVLDDGLTQRYLEPTKRFLVINDLQQFGNGETLPLGPNRLDFEQIKSDIDAIFVLKSNGSLGNSIELPMCKGIPVYYGKIAQDFKGISGRLMVFCGLGYPKKFFQIFSNFQVAKTISFPDHYPYKDSDIEELLSEAFRLKAQLVTTEKDLMRIPSKYWSNIKTVEADIVWETSINHLLEL